MRRHRKTFSPEPISGARADRLEGWRDLDADSPVREHYNIYPESDDEAAPAVDAGDGSASEGEGDSEAEENPANEPTGAAAQVKKPRKRLTLPHGLSVELTDDQLGLA